ncbi:hypothetical protein BDV24DRAFT_132288 [Aspergillus arachidicola]|uniref:Uncharacterized protein n=1 Tax=Aspergillus arachidicola TaxID=656916 RepID=A0A5N6Y807_9EURO|nr:hypothetical protein BDV24DRAFT_132288 [Aspergillus arachidicola]
MIRLLLYPLRQPGHVVCDGVHGIAGNAGLEICKRNQKSYKVGMSSLDVGPRNHGNRQIRGRDRNGSRANSDITIIPGGVV